MTNFKSRSSSMLDLSLDYDSNDDLLNGFTELACIKTGAAYSQINLFDENNQWTIAAHGMEFAHIPVEESICFITINKDDVFEIKDFTKDDRFSSNESVTGAPYLKYYIGFPFKDEFENVIGTICLLHTQQLFLSDNDLDFFKVIRKQIAMYLHEIREKNHLKDFENLLEQKINKIRHDIRGPISGVIGFTSLIEQDSTNKDILKKLSIIKKSSKNLLEYVEQSLQSDLENKERAGYHTKVLTVIDKLKSLFTMQSTLKEITIDVTNNTSKNTEIKNIATNHAINIIGNVLSNAIKFSKQNSKVKIIFTETTSNIEVSVKDTGEGISESKLQQLNRLEYTPSNTNNNNKDGFGIGLMEALGHLKTKGGDFEISSSKGKGTFVVLKFPK